MPNNNLTRQTPRKISDFILLILSFLIYRLNYITFRIIYGIIKSMKGLKKFWLAFLAAMPISAGAIGPLVIGTLAAGVGIVGVSIWRSVSPVNLEQAFAFFSSCWTCQMFSDIMLSMSTILPGIYRALGNIIIPMAASLLAKTEQLIKPWKIFLL